MQLANQYNLQKGLKQGIQQGIQQGKRDMVLSMLANGISLADVAKIAGLTEAEVRSMTQ